MQRKVFEGYGFAHFNAKGKDNQHQITWWTLGKMYQDLGNEQIEKNRYVTVSTLTEFTEKMYLGTVNATK